MKHFRNTLFIGSLIMLTACHAHLDNYQPMLAKGYQWEVFHQSEFIGEEQPAVSETLSMQLAEDTTLSGKTYKKLMVSRKGEPNQQLYALLREDIEQQKVYYWYKDEAVLLYDFGMKVGDKTKLYLNEFCSTRPIDYYLQLVEIRSKQDCQKHTYREFVYDVYCKENGSYVKQCSHITMERYGSYSGIICNNTAMLDGGETYKLLAAYNENHILCWNIEE